MIASNHMRDRGSAPRVVACSDVVVVGGGPTGFAAAIAAARLGVKVTLVERYPYLGGLASGGMVLVLDDMTNGEEITCTGICMEMIERMAQLGLCVYPPVSERRQDWDAWRKWSRWGVFDFRAQVKPQPIVFAAAFDPDGWKRAANDMVEDAGIELRLHSWFSQSIVENGHITGVVCETKAGPEAVLGTIVIDTTGDLDVAAAAGAPFAHGSYIVTTVFRLGGVDTEEAERFRFAEPENFHELDRQVKRLIGGAWDHWWLKTPLPGVVWCNCPHMTGLDGLKVEDLTKAEMQGRKYIGALIDYIRNHMPGFERCYLVDVAPQTGVRQTRLLEGEYVVDKEDLSQRTRFADTVARGRDYTTPYRAMLPRGLENLLVAGRHYSATPSAQKISREIPPCMAMGEAAGVAAAMALEMGGRVRDIDVKSLQRKLRAQGADPGDHSGPNEDVPAIARTDSPLELIA